MNKILPVILILVFLFGGGFLFFEERRAKEDVEIQLEQEREISGKWQAEMEGVVSMQRELEQERDSLRENAVRYLEINNKLKKENETLKSTGEEVERLKKIIHEKDGQIVTLEESSRTQRSAWGAKEKGKGKKRKLEQEKLIEEAAALNSKLDSLESTLTQERGLYHYNLGVAYVRAQLYEEALAAYQKSLKFRPNNPEAHYNLGLLYGEVKQDPAIAAFYYRKYLELNPEAEDHEDIQKLIDDYIADSL